MKAGHEWITALMRQWGIETETMGWGERALILVLIATVAFLADLICRKFLIKGVKKVTQRTKATWDDLLFNDRVLNHFCHLVPPVVLYVLIPFAFTGMPGILLFLQRICMIYIIAVSLKFINVFLGVVSELANQQEGFRDRPLKGVFQIVQVGLFFIGTILIISILINKSPLHLFAGLGASAAILMLVFKDTIVGFVSGIQLAANDMLRPGDWIQMPKYGADGIVIDVTLITVKVRNWDNTIVTIPPYALVSDAFQNWRGMRESGGRRIKRSINIDMNSVRFCTPGMLERLRNIAILTDYIDRTQQEMDCYNREHGIEGDDPANGQRQTNLGIFRAYLERYIETQPNANTDLMHMVRQLQPTEKGIPLELYFFSRQKDWIPYERLQADVFDHLLAILPEFGLRVFQSPTGEDLRDRRSEQTDTYTY